jgi:hypothetical protein
MEKAGHFVLLQPRGDASFIISINATCLSVSSLLPSFCLLWLAASLDARIGQKT